MSLDKTSKNEDNYFSPISMTPKQFYFITATQALGRALDGPSLKLPFGFYWRAHLNFNTIEK